MIYVTASWVNITGFTITNSGSIGDDAGIEFYRVENCYVAENNFSKNGAGSIVRATLKALMSMT